MTGFFSKLFGGKKDGAKSTSGSGTGVQGGGDAVSIVEETLNGVMERAGFELEFSVSTVKNGETEDVTVEMSGADEELLTEKDGSLLDAFQLLVKRVLQHQLPDARVEVHFDSNGFREESTRSLVDLADKLKDKCLESGKSQYMRALAPKDRKTVHQHLAGDERVRSRSIGEGLFKKVKIYPAKSAVREDMDERADDREENAETV
ncbi:MAG: hypothetical protein IPJ84_02200 [Bdellovibrionales bacterium]|nr:hypothetical protein [Bdellovibrionales bacterium]